MYGLLGSAINSNQDFPWLAWWRKATLAILDAVCHLGKAMVRLSTQGSEAPKLLFF